MTALIEALRRIVELVDSSHSMDQELVVIRNIALSALGESE